MRRKSGLVMLFSCCLGLAACTGSVSTGSKVPEPGGKDDPDTEFADKVEACKTSEVSLGAGKWRRLTRRQYVNTVKDLLGIEPSVADFLGDSTTGAFATNTLPPQDNDV